MKKSQPLRRRPIRNFIWKTIRWFFFRLDPEAAHRLGLKAIRLGIRCRGIPLRWVSGGGPAFVRKQAPVRVLGMNFQSRIGLAAGFDKDCEILAGLPDLGFGFAEIGTVTPLSQVGNPTPRIFRNVSDRAIFNRLGFPGVGALLVRDRLAAIKPNLPENFRVGVNIVKNRNTPPELAPQDYVAVAQHFDGLADFLVLNVSSPNTPGLRAFQTADALRPIIESLVRHLEEWKKRPPLLLKLAPELSEDTLKSIIEGVESLGISGYVLTNTWGGTLQWGEHTLSGGWSGKPLAEYSRKSLGIVRKLTDKTIISVGGIDSPEEAALRIQMGADLVQILTSWIYEGPRFPVRVSKALVGASVGVTSSRNL